MNYNDRAQLTMVFVASSEQEAEGDRIWKSHVAWMQETHYREGKKALLQYTVSKGTDEDGNIHFIVNEVYETAAGREDHIEQAHTNWKDYDAFVKWTNECKSSYTHTAIIHSLW